LPEYQYNTIVNGKLYGRHKTLKSAELLKKKLELNKDQVYAMEMALDKAKWEKKNSLFGWIFGGTADEEKALKKAREYYEENRPNDDCSPYFKILKDLYEQAIAEKDKAFMILKLLNEQELDLIKELEQAIKELKGE